MVPQKECEPKWNSIDGARLDEREREKWKQTNQNEKWRREKMMSTNSAFEAKNISAELI